MPNDKDSKDCVVAIVSDGQGRVLFGKRKDNNKWTLIAGHLAEGEDPEAGALREIFEETGLKPKRLSWLSEREGSGGAKIYFFTTHCPGTPTTKNDPDEECSRLEWVDVRKGVPKNIYNNLHGPTGDENIVRRVYDLKKSEMVWLDGGFLDLNKSESEVSTLLRHSNPLERSIALKLEAASPEDVSVAILDPDPVVWGAAFDHPHSSHAFDVLASSTRDSSGAPLWERHNLLLKHPGFNKRHLMLMASAVKSDSALGVKEQADRLAYLGLNGYSDIQKSIDQTESLIAHGSFRGDIADHTQEPTYEALKPLKVAYETNVGLAESEGPHKIGLHNQGNFSPKVVYKIGTDRVMVRPYLEVNQPLSGWGEGTSQSVFHAAGLGHLHQKSFVSLHGEKEKVPVTVVKLEEGAVPVSKAPIVKVRKQNPALDDEARKISVLDFLLDNDDRHYSNLMVQTNGHLLAVDNTSVMSADSWRFPLMAHSGVSVVLGSEDLTLPEYTDTIKKWWPEVRENVQKAFDERVHLIKAPSEKQRLSSAFKEKYNWLNSKADGGEISDLSDFGELRKTIEGADFLHTQHQSKAIVKAPDLNGVHDKLKMATPDAVKPHRQEFELKVNQHSSAYKPIMSYDPAVKRTQEMGEEPKAIYHTGKSKVMIKPQVSPTTTMSAWNEMTSQAMYHAGDIGHLHQKVHATTLANQKQTGTSPNGVVVHMADNVRPAYEAIEDYNDPRMERMADSGEHMQSLKKIGLMDWLTSNYDRHEGNIMIAPDGAPLAIDHGRSFMRDRHHAIGLEYDPHVEAQGRLKVAQEMNHPEIEKLQQGLHDAANQEISFTNNLYKDPSVQLKEFDNFSGDHSAAHTLGGAPDAETWKWFSKNKDKMRDAFIKHVNMLPDPNVRQRMIRSFDVRLSHLSNMSEWNTEFGSVPTLPGGKALPKSTLDQNGKTLVDKPRQTAVE